MHKGPGFILNAAALRLPFADGVFHTCITSPPYWGLRDYDVLGQLGLEPTPEEYVANIVAVFREVWRVLRPDATLWLNLGDCYATDARGERGADKSTLAGGSDWQMAAHPPRFQRQWRESDFGLKRKDLVGIPWRVAFALQADGWWLRQDNIWHKPNPMPESVTDRPTRAHEYVFLLSKSEHYFYDAEAVKEPVTGNSHPRGNGVNPKARESGGLVVNNKGQSAGVGAHQRVKQNASFSAAVTEPVAARNMRSVWTMTTQAYSGAHYATFPEALPERCILAGTSARGCCPDCGAAWERVVDGGQPVNGKRYPDNTGRRTPGKPPPRGGGDLTPRPGVTTAWRQTCDCPPDAPVPARVLDPFCGSGTTVQVARRLGRVGVGVDLSLAYLRDNALPRALGRSVDGALADLPLFSTREQGGGE